MGSPGKDAQKILAVDPSLSCSGWALFVDSVHGPVAAGVLSPPGPKLSLPVRMEKLQRAIDTLFEELCLAENDVLVCEGPAPLVKNPSSAIKVEGVRCLFEVLARRRGVIVPGRVNPRTIQSEILGLRGRQLPRATVKQVARTAALQLFGAELRELMGERLPQDIVDAVLIGSFAVQRLRLAIQTGLELELALAPRPRQPARNSSLREVSGSAGSHGAALKRPSARAPAAPLRGSAAGPVRSVRRAGSGRM